MKPRPGPRPGSCAGNRRFLGKRNTKISLSASPEGDSSSWLFLEGAAPPWVYNRLYHTGMDRLWKTPRIKRLQTLRGEMGVYHSLPTPSGVEKSIENPLNLTRGAAPPLSRKKRTLRRELTPGYPDIEIFFYILF